MPWRNPENWLSAELMAPLLSFVLAFFRTMYQDEEPSWFRRLLEATMCGLITFSVGRGITAMGFSGDWKYFVGGAIALLGVDFVRSLARKLINKKVSGK